ncbi:MAG: hypothetical protein Ct9H300mP13_5780 [Gammaproteobacteria bacterium]|nr:MAG: hypothetical protein Ct9H300mP13_5780 [Gammaproteobacteria bacterium]
MAVRIEKSGAVWTVIHSRPEARNAMDPERLTPYTMPLLHLIRMRVHCSCTLGRRWSVLRWMGP